MGFSYNEAMSLPIWQRQWFVDRMSEEIKTSEKTRGAHTNTVEDRTMQGNSRTETPAKLRRFT